MIFEIKNTYNNLYIYMLKNQLNKKLTYSINLFFN